MTENQKKIDDITRELKLDNDVYKKVMVKYEEEIDKGLKKASNQDATIKMFPTYVRSLPNGSENGDYLALDLGGTNFRVLNISLKDKKVEMKSTIFMVPPEIMIGPGEQLFDHIADCIAKFMTENNLMNLPKKIPLGFTFSFPLKQDSLNKARLVTWTKGFKSSGVEGNDVVRLLHEAITRRGNMNIECVAVINDTVGALISCAHEDPDCRIGLILGTGSNSCYMENLDRVELWDGDRNEPKHVIINTESGAFGDNGCLDFVRTVHDEEIDENSINPGKQKYEKMISGMYMGEIARRYLLKLATEGLIFNGQSLEALKTPGKFFTKYISEVESDEDSDFKRTRQALDELGLDNISTDDCRAVQKVCALVSSRSAFLASASMAVLLNRINRPNTTIAVDGSLYRFHPKFHDLMVQKIKDLINPGLDFKLMLSNDGSGKGAALVAAVAWRLRSDNDHQLQG